MKHDFQIPEADDILATLSLLPPRDISPAASNRILAEAQAILSRRKQTTKIWKECINRCYSNFLEPALVSSLILFYALWAFARAVQFLHL